MPTACFTLYMRAGMNEAEAVDALVQRLKSDGYLAETIQYNFSTLLSEAVVNINSDLILKDMDTFLPRMEEYESGEFWNYSHEASTSTPTSSSQNLLQATSRTAWDTRCRWAWTAVRR